MAANEFSRLKLFVAVARQLNFRRAAAEAGVSAAALSERIRALEAELGVRLFNRTTRSVALTQAGASLLERVAPALDTISAALAAAGTSAGAVSGRIRINGPRPALEFRLGPLMLEFSAAHPEVEFEVVADDGFVDVVGAGFDAGIRYGEKLERDMIAIPLGGPQRFKVVGAPDYLARAGKPLLPDDLVNHRCFAQLFPRGNRFAWPFERDGEVKDFPPQGSLASTEPSIQLLAAERGLGLALLFEEHCAAGIKAGRLVPVLDEWCAPFTGPSLYYPERRLLPAAMRAFVDFLRLQSRKGDVVPLRSGEG